MNLEEYSISVAEQFLQTAVFVDDKIFDEHREYVKTVSPDRTKKVRSAARKSAEKVTVSSAVSPQESARVLRCQDIVESFAKKRIVCSLYQLKRNSGAGPQSNLYKLVVSADILIIDWDIQGDKGVKASQLVASLVKSSLANEPEQLRSIVVYTAEPNLKASVADKLYEKLSEEVTDEFQIELKKEDRGLAFHTKNSRITVLGKPISGGRSPEYADNEVSEAELAQRTIKEFSKLAHGLLQGAALQGMALIRKNTRKIITMFGSELDGPFLLHRALSLPNEEAASHLIPLLVSEIESVLEDQIESAFLEEQILDDWSDIHAKAGSFARNKLPDSVDQKMAAKQLIKNGPAFQEFLKSKEANLPTKYVKGGIDDADHNWAFRSGEQAEHIGSFILDDTDAKLGQSKLAVLMSHRTFYSPERQLSLGSIVYDESSYYICVQPACDCVRLSGWNPFPVLKLSVSNTGFHVVVVENEQVVTLETDFKPSSISLIYFRADPKSGMVEAKCDNNEFYFRGGSSIKGPKRKYTLIGQLKTEQALRCVAKITAQLGRVGLTESVWARVMAK